MVIVLIGTYIQVLTFVLSVLFWNKYKHTHLKSLPFYFGFTAFVEMFCLYFYRQDNVWLYNLMTIFQFNYLCYLFYPYVSHFFRKGIIGLAFVFNITTGIFYSFGVCDFWNVHCSYAYVLGIFFLLIIISQVLLNILNSHTSLGYNLLFWLCFGFLIFFATSLPLFSISNWSDLLGEYDARIPFLLVFSVLISHLILIFGFLWSKKKYTY